MKHVDEKNNLNDPVDLIDRMKPMKAQRTKEQVWTELEAMVAQEPSVVKVRKLTPISWQVAASVAILVCLSVLSAKYYTKSIYCAVGEQKTAMLPDGSSVSLNAKSSVSFHPFWWKFDKTVTLEGEGFFEGKHAKGFTVSSTLGEVTVLGTSFNIFARDNDYEVTCLTGKVRVKSNSTNEETIINPNEMISLKNSGSFGSKIKVDAKLALDWTNGQFIFTQIPLKKVLSEVSRRYGIAIENIDDLNQPYTGSFTQQNHIEAVLDIICKPFGLDYKKLPSGGFVIEQAP
ncbi:MAG: FecR domain-containing protein [Sphingobacteriales bacterium]|nr:FecR domain-containing protein [Sphingobacteriales bacterium]